MTVTRIFDLMEHYLENYPDQDAALAYKRRGEWKKFSIQEYVDAVNNISYGLLALGAKKGDNIGIVGGNRPQWNMLDMAIMQIGAISIPIYPTISQDDYRHILNHAEMKMIFIDGRDLSKKLEPVMPEVKTLKEIFLFDEEDGEYKHIDQIVELGKENPVPEELKKIKDSIKSEDMATIVYTSGTTGDPKGVMLSHSNIVNQLENLKMTPAKWSKTALSFLPLCHAYERMMVYLYQYLGMSIYYAESLGTIAENIKEVNPTMMTECLVY